MYTPPRKKIFYITGGAMRFERTDKEPFKTRVIRVFLFFPLTIQTNATYQYRKETRWLEMANILQSCERRGKRLVWRNYSFLDGCYHLGLPIFPPCRNHKNRNPAGS
jgi:hypothetical protein